MSFGIGLHAMVALAYNEGKRLPSSALASSIGANAVTVRRILAQLGAAGLVETISGPGGGSCLARAATKITAYDVYEAIGEPPFVTGHTKDPQKVCIVSECMPSIFERLESEVADKAIPVLRKTTLQSLVDQEVG